jgi:hypothetical protein
MSIEVYKAAGWLFMIIAGILFSSQDALTKGIGVGFFFGVLAGGMLVGHAALQARKGKLKKSGN